MTTHSSILAWRIPWTVWESQRVGHNWATFTFMGRGLKTFFKDPFQWLAEHPHLQCQRSYTKVSVTPREVSLGPSIWCPSRHFQGPCMGDVSRDSLLQGLPRVPWNHRVMREVFLLLSPSCAVLTFPHISRDFWVHLIRPHWVGGYSLHPPPLHGGSTRDRWGAFIFLHSLMMATTHPPASLTHTTSS